MSRSRIQKIKKEMKTTKTLKTIESMEEDQRSLTELPDPLLLDILTRLPASSVLACCFISKKLGNLVENDGRLQFAELHFKRSQPQLLIHFSSAETVHMIDFDAHLARGFGDLVPISPQFDICTKYASYIKDPVCSVVANSCRGLICLRDDSHNYMVCNPVTGEYINLPTPGTGSEYQAVNVRCAFGYSPSTNKFKVLRICHENQMYSDDGDDCENCYSYRRHFPAELEGEEDEKALETCKAEICVVGSDNRYWTELGYGDESKVIVEDWYEEYLDPLFLSSPCYLDKAIHWITSNMTFSDFIVFFDFETEKLGQIPTPSDMGKSRIWREELASIGVFHGSLTICDTMRREGEGKFAIWVMKRYGVRGSWTREFLIDTMALGVNLRGMYEPIRCLINGEIVMLSHDGKLLCYDPSKKTVRLLQHYLKLKTTSFEALVHTPSFVPLKDALGCTGKKVLKIEPRSVRRKSKANQEPVLVEFLHASADKKQSVPIDFFPDWEAPFAGKFAGKSRIWSG